MRISDCGSAVYSSYLPLIEYTRPSIRGSANSPTILVGSWQLSRPATSPTSVVPSGHSAAVGGGVVGGGVVGGVVGGGVVVGGGGNAPSPGAATLSEPPTHALSAKAAARVRSEEHTSELQARMHSAYAGCCLKHNIANDNNTVVNENA